MRVGLASASLAFIAVGCAVGTRGAVVVRTTTTDTATIFDVYSAGVILRPASVERGLSLGLRRATYVIARDEPETEPVACQTEWSVGGVHIPVERLVLRGQQVVGIETEASRQLGRVAVGYVDTVLTAGPDAGKSVIVQLRWERARPCRTEAHLEEIIDGKREIR